MFCCKQDGDCPVNFLLGLVLDAVVALGCTAALY